MAMGARNATEQGAGKWLYPSTCGKYLLVPYSQQAGGKHFVRKSRRERYTASTRAARQ
jgi:hypothetical protein